MAIKDILVLLDTTSQAVGPYAVSLASTFDAHLTAATVVVDPTTIVGIADAPAVFLPSVLEDARVAARGVLEAFETTARRSGLAIETEPVETVVGMVGQALGPIARLFDLAIVEQPSPDIPAGREIIIEAALFGSGLPVLLIPYVHKAPFRLENVLVACDGSVTAARALGDGMPFLERAKRVELVTVSDVDVDIETAGRRLRRHLARHGLNAEFHRLTGAEARPSISRSRCRPKGP